MGKRKHRDKTPKGDNVDLVVTEKGHDLPSPRCKPTVQVSETAAPNGAFKSKHKRSKKAFVTSESEQNMMSDELKSTNSLKSQNKKSKKNKSSQNSNESTDVFVDKVIVGTKHETIPPQKSSKKKNKQNMNVDEEEVHDEEIDNYCNNLSEQDNAQYDQWIQLLEAKLKSNKKS